MAPKVVSAPSAPSVLEGPGPSSEAVYAELPLPIAAYPDRVLYAVRLRGFANPHPAELLPATKTELCADPTKPWLYPTLQVGQRIKDVQELFTDPPPNVRPNGRVTIRGWKVLRGPAQDTVAFELLEAAVISVGRRQVLGVWLWCPAQHEDGRLGEHGPFFGRGQRLAIVEDQVEVPPALTGKPSGKSADGRCPHCKSRDNPSEDIPERVREAIERRHWYING